MSVVEAKSAEETDLVAHRHEEARRIQAEDALRRLTFRARSSPHHTTDDLYDDPVCRELIDRLGLCENSVRQAQSDARRNGTDAASELIANAVCSDADYSRAVAELLGVPFEPPAHDDIVIVDPRREFSATPEALKTCNNRLETKIFVQPALDQIGAWKQRILADPCLAERLRVTTSQSIREKRAASDQKQRFDRATLSLSLDRLHQSARIVLTGWQGVAIGAGTIGAAWIAATDVRTSLSVLHIVTALLFSTWICFRFYAAFARRAPALPLAHKGNEPGLPIYTVVVALHREHEVVGKLISNLEALNWPRSRLEIFLVCEADDPRTIGPCRQRTIDKPQFQVLLVPPGEPRTKPKALNHVLPLARGDYLVLYDAEDAPDPDQLREAHLRYSTADRTLACLQAPLVIRNGNRNWLTAMFALEYAALFRALLPFLAHHRLPIPLGGTSNHFRIAALRDVGGWDSHNVTEDADLGIRLKRMGYGVGTIDRPTFEDAPETFAVWLRQRTRWLKGWLQTYAVHMRAPYKLVDELGFRGFMVFQLIFHGMISAALLLPIAGLLAIWTAIDLESSGWPASLAADLLVLDGAVFIGGILSFVALACRGSTMNEIKTSALFFLLTPCYWLLVSLAAYRGLAQLFVAPHVWEKTPHGLACRADKRDFRHRVDPIFDIATF